MRLPAAAAASAIHERERDVGLGEESPHHLPCRTGAFNKARRSEKATLQGQSMAAWKARLARGAASRHLAWSAASRSVVMTPICSILAAAAAAQPWRRVQQQLQHPALLLPPALLPVLSLPRPQRRSGDACSRQLQCQEAAVARAAWRRAACQVRPGTLCRFTGASIAAVAPAAATAAVRGHLSSACCLAGEHKLGGSLPLHTYGVATSQASMRCPG